MQMQARCQDVEILKSFLGHKDTRHPKLPTRGFGTKTKGNKGDFMCLESRMAKHLQPIIVSSESRQNRHVDMVASTWTGIGLTTCLTWDAAADKRMGETLNWNSELKCTNNGENLELMRNFIYDSLSLSVCSEILAEIGSLCGQASGELEEMVEEEEEEGLEVEGSGGGRVL